MKEDFIAFKQYYSEAARQIPTDSFYYGTLNHKFRHSVDVLQVGRQIMQNTPELKDCSQKFYNLAEKALLFHDVGRFNEAVCLYQAQLQNQHMLSVANKSDHGAIGYELLKNNPRYKDIRILLAIKYHGKMMEDVQNSELWSKVEKTAFADEAKQILYLVRDADKLANLAFIKKYDHLKDDLFFKQLTPQALHAGISEPVMQQFLAQKTVLIPSLYSFADRILLVISWIFDLNYQYAKKMFVDEGYMQYLLAQLSEYHQQPADIEKIKNLCMQYIAKM